MNLEVSAVAALEEIPRLSIAKAEPGRYEYAVRSAGEELYAGHDCSTITDAIRDAINTKPTFLGFEISYEGYVVGTYTLHELTSDPESVAVASVRTKSKFMPD